MSKKDLIAAALAAESRKLRSGTGDPEGGRKGPPCTYCKRPVTRGKRLYHAVCKAAAAKKGKAK